MSELILTWPKSPAIAAADDLAAKSVHIRKAPSYSYRDKYDDTKNEAWAIGGALSYKSGWFLNH